MKFNFGHTFQINLLKMMLDSTSFLLLCKKYIKTNYFSTASYQYMAGEIFGYFDKYGYPPDKAFIESIVKNEKDEILYHKVMKHRIIQQDFIKDKLKEFVQRSMYIDSYKTSGQAYNDGKVDEAFQIMMKWAEEISHVTFEADRFSYLLKDFKHRLREREDNINTLKLFKVKTGIHKLDFHLKGGVAGGELFFWMADAKGGKSFAMIYNGTTSVKRYVPTLHVFLEGIKDQNESRYDACFTNTNYDLVRNAQMPQEQIDKMTRIAKGRRYRDLVMRHYSDWEGYTVRDLERDLIDLRNKNYDIKEVIVDYFDLMGARKGKKFNSETDRQKSISRDLKTFGTKYNVAVITATQTNRGIEADDPNFLITSKNSAEDYNKIRALDHLVTINGTSEEIAQNKRRLYLDTSRDVQSKKVIRIKNDLSNSRFYVKE